MLEKLPGMSERKAQQIAPAYPLRLPACVYYSGFGAGAAGG